MNPGQSDAAITSEEAWWGDTVSATDPSLYRSRPVPYLPPWTEKPQEEQEISAKDCIIIYHGDTVKCLLALAPSVATGMGRTHKYLSQYGLTLAVRYAELVSAEATGFYSTSLQNSTVQQDRPQTIDQEIEGLFQAAKEEAFEDGVETYFSRRLVSLVKKYGDSAMELVSYLIDYEKVNPEVAAEALRWLGSMDHPATYQYRLWLAERSLRCSSSRVRDGAILALAYLDDPHAISPLKQAIERENIEELREDMSQILASLNRSH